MHLDVADNRGARGVGAGIIREVVGIASVTEARGTYGIYDMFCKIEAKDRDAIDDMMTKKIRKIAKIRSTTALHWIPSQGGM